MHINELIYRRWVEELWNKNNISIIDELFDENGVAHFPNFIANDPALIGRDALKRFVYIAREKAEVVRADIEDISCDGDRLVSICNAEIKLFEKRNDGSNAHAQMVVKSLVTVKFRDGMIFELWNNVQFVNKDARTEVIEMS